MFISAIVVLFVVDAALGSSGASNTSVYEDEASIVKTETREYTDESGAKHFERKITKQGKAGSGFVENHFTRYSYQEPREILSSVHPSSILPQFLHNGLQNQFKTIQDDRKGPHDRPQNNGSIVGHPQGHQSNPVTRQVPPMSNQSNNGKLIENERRKTQQDLHIADERRAEKNDPRNTSALSITSRTEDYESPANKTTIIAEERVKPIAIENENKLESKSTLESRVQRNHSDQEVAVNDGLKVYFGGGDNERAAATNKNINANTKLKDDGKIFFEPELNRSRTEDNSNIMKIDKGKEDVSSTTEAVASSVDLDNRNAFDVNITCEPGKAKIRGICIETE